MVFVLPFPVYPRHLEEHIFKGLYQLVFFLHVTTFVVLVTEFYVLTLDTLSGHFLNAGVPISGGLELATRDCKYSSIIRFGSFGMKIDVKSDSLSFPSLLVLQYILFLLVFQFVVIVISYLGFLSYSSGIRHLRVCGVHIPFYHILAICSFQYCIVLIILVWLAYPVRKFYADGIRKCAEQSTAANPTSLFEAEYGDDNIFSISVVLMFVSALINVIVDLMGFFVLMWKSSDQATILFSEAKVPWEDRGVLCKTDKVALRFHTAARDEILEEARGAIARGERVRVACSYALMTEKDYNEQMTELREQFYSRMREQQFEHMRAHLDGDSCLGESSGLVRRHSPPPPSSEPDGPDFFEIGDDGDCYDGGSEAGGDLPSSADMFAGVIDDGADVFEESAHSSRCLRPPCAGCDDAAETPGGGGREHRGRRRKGRQHRGRRQRRGAGGAEAPDEKEVAGGGGRLLRRCRCASQSDDDNSDGLRQRNDGANEDDSGGLYGRFGLVSSPFEDADEL